MSAEKQKTLLLVEDEVIIAMSEKLALERYGYGVIIAGSGEAAVAAVEKTPAIDLILMDINLGAGMDGTEAAAAILERRDLPVVFLSSHVEPEVVARTEKITSYGYVVKDSSATVLDASIKMAFKLFAAKVSEKRKEEALRESETRLRVLFSGASDGILVADSQTWKFRYANPAICRMMGYTEEELLRLGVNDIHPRESLQRVLAEFAAMARGEIKTSTDLPCLRKDGSVFYCNISHGTMVIDGQVHVAGFFHDITERRRSEAALQESEEIMRYIVKHDPNAIAVYDRGLRYIAVSDRYLQDYNVREAGIIGKHHYEVFPEMPQKWKDVHQRCLAGAVERNDDDFFERPDGSITYNRWECRPWRRADGEIGGIITYTEVTTERKQAEIKLAKSHDLLTKLARLVPGVIYQYRLDPDGRSAFPYASPGMNDIYEVTPEEVREDATPVFGRLHPDDYDMVAGAIQASAQTLNTFYCEFRVILPRQGLRWRWSQAHPERLADGGTLWHGIISDITERKLAEATLRESEERMRAIVEGTPHLFFYVQDAEAKNTYVSPTIERVTGYDAATWLKRNDWFTTDAPINQSAREKTRSHLRGEFDREPVLLEIRHARGHAILLETYEYPIKKDGRVVGLQGVAHDITDRQRTEKALRETETRYRLLFASSPDGIVIIDPETMGFLEFNEKAHQQLGYTRGEFAALRISDLDVVETLQETRARISSVMQEGLQEFETRHRTKQGEIRDIHVTAQFSEIEGHAVYHCIWRDITESKRAREALRASEERLRDIIFSMADWVWEVDGNGVYTFSSDKGSDLLGASRGDIIGKTPFDFMPADEAKRVGAIFSEIVANKLPIRDLENWNIGKDGERICLSTSGVPIIDAQGNLRGYRGVDKDITGRKRAEEEVQNTLRFEQALLDAVPSPIFYKDAKGLYLGGNKAFERYIGMTREQFTGKSVFDISPADLAETYDRADRELLAGKGVQTYEASVAAADGTRRDVVFSKAVFTDARGEVAGLIGVILDITERKRAERLAATLVAISQAIFTSRDLDELYQRIHGYIAGIVPADNFFIALLTDDGQLLEFPYYRDEKDTSDSDVIPVGDSQSLTVEVLRAKKPLLLDDAQLRERYATGRNRVWGTAPKCWLGVPLLIQDDVIGVMAIQDYHDGGAYGQKDVALLESTAGQVAIAIARKRTEKALRESVEAFRGYFNMGTVGVCVTSPEKGWIEVNDYMCRMLGYTREELLRLTWAEMTHPDDLNADVALFNQVLAGRRDSYELEKRFIRKDGQTIYTLLYATCQRKPDGSVHHFLVSLVDISERKKAEILEQAVYEIARAADQAASLDDLYRSVHRIIRTLMPATNILIARYDEKENLVSFPYFVDEKDPMPKSRKASRGLTDYVLRTGKTLLSDAAVEKELERSGEAKRRGSPSACWLGVPLKVGDKAIGVIALDNYSDPKAYGEREKKILEYVSGQIANAIARKQAEEEIKRQLAEKEILLKEVHHRIKNNFASIAGLISLRLQSISNPEAAAVLKDAFGRIDSMRILYDKLLLSEEYNDLPVKNYVASLVDTVMALFPGSAEVTLDQRIADFQLDSKRLFSLGIIINELLTNKMKYAFCGRKRGAIRIDLVREGTRVTLVIEDDGNVLPAGFDLNDTKGFGLMLVKMLSQQLEGSFSMDSKKGTRCTVAFDI